MVLMGLRPSPTTTGETLRKRRSSQPGFAPTNDLESAIFATLDPGAYTAILSGNNSGTGTGLVEIYDLSQTVESKLANISTRGFVGTGSDIVIAGFILGGGSNDDTILLRGIGPSLGPSGFTNALSNPALELRNGDGAVVVVNDDWQNGPPVSLPPSDPLESAIETTLSPGAYTALLFGVNNGTGVGLVEIYDLGAPTPTPSPTPGEMATHFVFDTPVSFPLAWTFQFTVTVQDRFNNTAADYIGTVHFTSTTTTAAGLPSDSTLINGIGIFEAGFGAEGPQTITATDTNNAFITGTSSLIYIYDEVPPTPTPTPGRIKAQ